MIEVEKQPELSEREVAITGRLASMTRDEAHARIDEAGGSYVDAPAEETDMLVVGQGGPPLGEDGHLTKSLEEARELQERGHRIRIVSEEEFLARLGLEDRQDDLRRLFTTAQLARILGVTPGAVRVWTRHGLIRPAREVNRLAFYDFQQVASAGTLSRLARAGVSPRRIRKSLEQLAGWMPRADASLAQLAALERGGPLLIRTEEGRLAEPSGQLVLDFEREVAPPDASRPGTPTAIDRTLDANEWFELGVHAEGLGHHASAARAYETAIERGNEGPEVRFNLGNVLVALERKKEAVQRFEEAIDLDPRYVEAWNNLGNVCGDLGRTEEAVAGYRRALMIAPDYADAHFNLAELLAARGDEDRAHAHWEAYLEQDPHSSFAELVRARLAGADDIAPPP
ncbi:MAG: tetratricopeptide repeat protein [Planctomycetota bacterium]|nr:tetratricopeptide repeat protein [Planctomycetota bacterium]